LIYFNLLAKIPCRVYIRPGGRILDFKQNNCYPGAKTIFGYMISYVLSYMLLLGIFFVLCIVILNRMGTLGMEETSFEAAYPLLASAYVLLITCGTIHSKHENKDNLIYVLPIIAVILTYWFDVMGGLFVAAYLLALPEDFPRKECRYVPQDI
jgi:hypothetical protein